MAAAMETPNLGRQLEANWYFLVGELNSNLMAGARLVLTGAKQILDLVLDGSNLLMIVIVIGGQCCLTLSPNHAWISFLFDETCNSGRVDGNGEHEQA